MLRLCNCVCVDVYFGERDIHIIITDWDIIHNINNTTKQEKITLHLPYCKRENWIFGNGKKVPCICHSVYLDYVQFFFFKKKDTIVLFPRLSFKPNKPMKICYPKRTKKPTRMTKITKAQIECFFFFFLEGGGK